MLRSAPNHRFPLMRMIHLYIRLRDTIFRYYFDVFINLHLKILFGTSFIDKNMKTILQTKSLLNPIYSRPLTILVHNDLHVLAIQLPQSLEPYERVKDSVNISVAKKTIIASMKQGLVLVSTPTDRLMYIHSHPRMNELHQ